MTLQVVLPVFTALLIYGERMREVATKREVIAGERKETLTFNLFMFCGVLIIVSGIIEYFWRERRLFWPTYLLGVLISIAAFVIRRWAITTLGRFWSLHVEIREEHEIVTAGPFRWVRHPVYFGMILEFLGLGLILNATFTLVLVMTIFLPTLVARVRLEETALVQKFGTAYADYCQTTPLLIPWHLPRM
jgi:protein-S-isoprenylcysteine O-methyltransferase Ste14